MQLFRIGNTFFKQQKNCIAFYFTVRLISVIAIFPPLSWPRADGAMTEPEAAEVEGRRI